MKTTKFSLAFLAFLSVAVLASNALSLRGPNNFAYGVDVQVQEMFQAVAHKRVAMLTNPSCVDNQKNLIFDVLFQNQAKWNYTLEYGLAPEHGIRGDQDAGSIVLDYVDPVTNITIYSLYGTRKAPTPEMLSKIDVIVHCILDVGTRFYTFDWTMSYAQEAVGNYNFNQTQIQQQAKITTTTTAESRLLSSQQPASNNTSIRFVVIDRPNVLGGVKLEGCPLEIEAGYIGRLFTQNFTIPTRYAMTTGELALLFNYQYFEHPVEDLKIIKILNYTRLQGFPNPSLWVPPSPNMRTFETAYVYPGTGIFEQTNLSEGRGTDAPFQTIGAPFVNSTKLVDALNADHSINRHARFSPITFTPTTSKFVNQTCHGVFIEVINKDEYDSVLTGTVLLQILLRQHPNDVILNASGANKIFGTKNFYSALTTTNQTIAEILDSCEANRIKFLPIREKYLIYDY